MKSATRQSLTVERLREVLDYNRDTGIFRWRITHSRIRRGSVAGTLNKRDGYWTVHVDGWNYMAHVLAWRYVTGEWPENDIDHRDRCRANNAFDNLRPASEAETSRNQSLRKDNKSGFKGVFWNSRLRKWTAKIQAGGAKITLGNFNDVERAAESYRRAAELLHGEFATTGRPLRPESTLHLKTVLAKEIQAFRPPRGQAKRRMANRTPPRWASR